MKMHYLCIVSLICFAASSMGSEKSSSALKIASNGRKTTRSAVGVEAAAAAVSSETAKVSSALTGVTIPAIPGSSAATSEAKAAAIATQINGYKNDLASALTTFNAFAGTVGTYVPQVAAVETGVDAIGAAVEGVLSLAALLAPQVITLETDFETAKADLAALEAKFAPQIAALKTKLSAARKKAAAQAEEYEARIGELEADLAARLKIGVEEVEQDVKGCFGTKKKKTAATSSAPAPAAKK